MNDAERQHREEASSRLSQMGQRYFSLIEFDEDEELVIEIRKHPFGLFLIEAMGVFVSSAIAIAGIVLGMNIGSVDATIGTSSSASFQVFVIGVSIILAILGLVATVIGMIIYRSNVIFVTSEKLAQVLYKNIIDRKISQLSIGDVQDVTVNQKGIFARIFKYGTLIVETAGEQQNYTFTFVPSPYEAAKSIVGAHETNLRKYGN